MNLKSVAHEVKTTPADEDGFAVRFTLCGELTAEHLPEGCLGGFAIHPSAVKFKVDTPSNCQEIGSIGPCDKHNCFFAGKATKDSTGKPDGGVDITYSFDYGCNDLFSLALTPGAESEPGVVTSDRCGFTGTWAALPWPADSPCRNDPCSGHGRCVPKGSEASCECEKGYSGEQCQTYACDGVECGEHGTCVINTGGCVGGLCEGKCKCNGGWSLGSGGKCTVALALVF